MVNNDSESLPVGKSGLFTSYEELKTPTQIEEEQDYGIDTLGNLVGMDEWIELEKRIQSMIRDLTVNIKENDTAELIGFKYLATELVRMHLERIVTLPYESKRAMEATRRAAGEAGKSSH